MRIIYPPEMNKLWDEIEPHLHKDDNPPELQAKIAEWHRLADEINKKEYELMLLG